MFLLSNTPRNFNGLGTLLAQILQNLFRSLSHTMWARDGSQCLGRVKAV